MKKLRVLKFGAVIALIVCAVVLILGFMDTRQPPKATLPKPVVPTRTATPTSTSTPTPTSKSTASAKPAKNAAAAAVAAATTSLSVLSTAILLPQVEMHSAISNLVVPELRKPIESTMTETGPQIVSVWGYSTVAAANTGAGYSVETQEYRIDSLNRTEAVVSLFVVTRWVTSDSQEYLVPAITVVRMRMVNGSWLYVSSSKPPSNQTPPSQPGLSFEQTVQRFQPFLKGYRSNGSDS